MENTVAFVYWGEVSKCLAWKSAHINEMPCSIKTSLKFFQVGCTEKQILHIIYLFMEKALQRLGKEQ